MEIQKLEKDVSSGQYIYGATLTSDTGVAVSIPDSINSMTVGLLISSGSGKVQYTIDSLAAVSANTAVWLDWPGGTVTTNTVDSINTPVTAVRGAWVSGTVKFRVVG